MVLNQPNMRLVQQKGGLAEETQGYHQHKTGTETRDTRFQFFNLLPNTLELQKRVAQRWENHFKMICSQNYRMAKLTKCDVEKARTHTVHVTCSQSLSPWEFLQEKTTSMSSWLGSKINISIYHSKKLKLLSGWWLSLPL